MHAYETVRSRAGLFAMRHKCLVDLSGADAQKLVETLLCGDVRDLPVGQERFSPMLNLQGGIMDAVLVLHPAEQSYRLIINRICHEKDLRHIRREVEGDVTVSDLDGSQTLLLLLGPESARLLGAEPKEGEVIVETEVCGIRCTTCRMPRFGMDGFFLIAREQDELALIHALGECGVPLCTHTLLDTLMLEAGMPVYGREMDDTLNPFETGLASRVRIERQGFVGREALIAAGEPRRTLIGLVLERFGAEHGMPVVKRDKHVGYVTGARYCPGLGKFAAMALVEKPYREAGRRLCVETADGLIEGVVTALPLVKE